MSVEDLILDLIEFFSPLSTGSRLPDGFNRRYMDRKTRGWPTVPISVSKALRDRDKVTLTYRYSVDQEI